VKHFLMTFLLLAVALPSAAMVELDETAAAEFVLPEEVDASTCLVLGEELSGRFVVRGADRELVAEVYKRPGKIVVVGLAPGAYEVRCERADGAVISAPVLEEGERLLLGPEDFVADEGQVATGLVLAEELAGRFFVRDADRELVAELYKPRGRVVEVGLAPGVYEVRCEQETGALISALKLGQGEVLMLEPRDFAQAEPERGVERILPPEKPRSEPRSMALKGRSRLELRFGAWEHGWGSYHVGAGSWGVVTRSGSDNATGSLGYSRWLREDLAVTFSITGLGGEAEVVTGAHDWYTTVDSSGVGSFLVGLRKYIWGSETVKPYLAGSLGPYIGGTSVVETRSPGHSYVEERAEVAFGGHVGAGFDVRLGRNWMLGISGGYNFMSDFRHPIGGRDNYGGGEMGVSFSWLFGGPETDD